MTLRHSSRSRLSNDSMCQVIGRLSRAGEVQFNAPRQPQSASARAVGSSLPSLPQAETRLAHADLSAHIGDRRAGGY